jgi:hypothetical protein
MGILCLLLFDYLRIKNFLVDIPENISRLWREDKIAILGILLVVFLLSLHYAASVVTNLETSDDLQAYSVFPQKMLQSGALGEDPFSERRTHALGGHSFLHVLIISLLQLRNLRIIDPGIAYIIAVAILWGMSKETKVPRKTALFIFILFLLIPLSFTNTSSMVMGLVLLLALFRVFDSEEALNTRQSVAKGFIVALLISAICASKSNFMVFCVPYFFISYFLRFLCLPEKKHIALEFFIAAILIFLFLLPWMVSSYYSSGTLLYPLLGRGYHRSAYGFPEYPPMKLEDIIRVSFRTLCSARMFSLIAFCLISFKNPSRRNIIRSTAICISAVLGVIIVKVLLKPPGKYYFPFFYASFTILMLYAFSDESSSKGSFFRKIPYILVIILIPLLFRNFLFQPPSVIWENTISRYLADIRTGLKEAGKPLCPDNEAISYLKAQQSVPQGQVIIARLTHPFLLDFKRNKIFIVDWLILGPKPGMPVFQGGEAVAGYLISRGIRYVMYFCGETEVHERRSLRLHLEGPNYWLRQQAFFTLRFQDVLTELGATRKRIYDDGRIFVLDLYTKAPNTVIPEK